MRDTEAQIMKMQHTQNMSIPTKNDHKQEINGRSPWIIYKVFS